MAAEAAGVIDGRARPNDPALRVWLLRLRTVRAAGTMNVSEAGGDGRDATGGIRSHQRQIALLVWTLLAAVLPSGAASAAELPGVAIATPDVGPRKILLILFLMLGPIKILVPFVTLTQGMDAGLRKQLATRSIVFAVAAIALAGVFGRVMMANFNVSVPVLALTGGIVLFLVALRTVLQQSFVSSARPRQGKIDPGLHLALTPLAFPTIVTPYGIAAVIVFATLLQEDLGAELILAAIVILILAMDWLAMIYADAILKSLGTALQVFAVILGVAQIALGLQIIFHSLSWIGVPLGRTA